MADLRDSVVRLPDGRIGLRLAPREREILGALVEDLAAVLGDAWSGPRQTPLDEEPWDDAGGAPDAASRMTDPDADESAVGGGRTGDAFEELADGEDPVATDPVLRRLYPDARPDDPRASRRFRDLVRADLDDDRRADLAVVEATLDAREIDDAEGEAWLRVINAVRLVLGTRLDVTEDSEAAPFDAEDPEAAAKLVFAWAGWLEGQLVDVLAAALPDVQDPNVTHAPDADDDGDEDPDPDDEAIGADDS